MEHERKATENFILIQYVYAGLCILYLLLGIRSNSKLLKMVLKCAPIATLVGLTFYTAYGIFTTFGPLFTGAILSKLWYLMWALVFSLLGDIYLVFDSLFLLGVVSFAVAQATYIYFFGGAQLLLMIYTNSLEQPQITAAIAVGLVSTLFYLYLFPKFKCVMAIFALMYSLLISLMLWSAFSRALMTPITPNRTAAIGACLFYTSDLVLSLKEWRFSNMLIADYFIIVTYYGAQLLIARSVFVTS